MKAGQRCPKCGWHMTPMNMKYHRGVFGTEDEPFDWTECTEPHPNKIYLAKYKYNHETEEWE